MDIIRPYLELFVLMLLLWSAVSIFFSGFGYMLKGPKGFGKIFSKLFLAPVRALLVALRRNTIAILSWLTKKSWNGFKRFIRWFGRKVWHG